MPLFAHPLQPLTRTGRVILCIAASVFAALLIVAWTPAHADDSQALPAEGPYFQVASSDPAVDALPLKRTEVDVRIAGVIADVAVTQTYRNEGQRAIEAKYVFPGSTRAAVHAMTVRLGGRVIRARIQEKQKARVEFEAAKREGKTTALLEQERPNVFQMNVANILPGDTVEVELHYSELIAPTDGRYQFVYPTVVGPRYHRAVEAGGNSHFPATPVQRPGTPVAGSFDLHVLLDAPLPVNAVQSPSHALEVMGEGSTKVSVSLKGSEPAANRDFILGYSLAGEHVSAGLMLHKGEKENFFLALVQPPQAIETAQINPRDYVFVVDISGSMHGFPLDTAKVLLRDLIGHLRPSDTFNVMLFSGSNRMLNDSSVPATRANIDRAIATIDRMGGGGSTEIVPALRRVAALPKQPDVARTVIVVTDGYVTVEDQVFQLIRRNLDQANVFAFGIGSSVNRHLIEGIARAGMGEAFIVTKPDEATAQAERLRHMIDSPVLTSVAARFNGLEVYDVEPAVLPDVLGGRPVMVFGKWRAAGGDPLQARLLLQGKAASGDWQQVLQPAGMDDHGDALRLLWARHRIASLSDQEALTGGQTQRDTITALGLQHGLLTQYTSFIAIDEVVRTKDSAVPVNQPLPLPQGVSPLAVGGEVALGAPVPSTPEPGGWVSLLVVGLLLVGAAASRGRYW